MLFIWLVKKKVKNKSIYWSTTWPPGGGCWSGCSSTEVFPLPALCAFILLTQCLGFLCQVCSWFKADTAHWDPSEFCLEKQMVCHDSKPNFTVGEKHLQGVCGFNILSPSHYLFILSSSFKNTWSQSRHLILIPSFCPKRPQRYNKEQYLSSLSRPSAHAHAAPEPCFLHLRIFPLVWIKLLSF